MTLKLYLKDIRLTLLAFVLIVATINLVLVTSNNINETLGDIVYMDILILFIAIVFLIFGFKRRKDKYGDLVEALNLGSDIDNLLPRKYDFYSNIMRKLVDYKNDEMYAKTKELKESLDDVNDYIIKWVHEIKLPMSVCEIISDKLEDEDNVEILSKVSEDLRLEIERMTFLVEQVLYISRASSYSNDLQINEVNIEKVVRGVIRKNTSFFIANKIDLQLLNLKLNVMTDEKWMSYVMEQIVNNACKYSREGGEIKIWAEEDHNKDVKLHIKDNGTGIAPKDIERIFDKGFTGDNGRKVKKSTGIGLYISKKMFKRMGHDIKVYSKEGKYTEFILIFYKLSDYFNVT